MDKERIGKFANAVYRDMAGAMAIGMGYLGLKSGLFEAMKDGELISATDLAEKTGLTPRYVEEWLNGMTTAGWLDHNAEAGTFAMPEEHGFLLASEGTDHYMGGLFLAGPSLLSQAPDVARAFREGGGVHFDAFDVAGRPHPCRDGRRTQDATVFHAKKVPPFAAGRIAGCMALAAATRQGKHIRSGAMVGGVRKR